MKRKTSISLALLALAFASLACTMFVGGPDYTEGAIPVSTDSVGQLQDEFKKAQEQAIQTGTLTLTINETQLTSVLAYKLQQDPDPLLTDPQVYLRDGQIKIYGKATQGNLQANVGIVLSLSLDPTGKPVITVISADFGPLPAPEGINSAISAAVEEAFTGSIGPAALGFRLETVTIADGVMTLSGRTK
jgi:hypothetical protein